MNCFLILVISFLREQYYTYFNDEVEIPDLLRHGILLSHKLMISKPSTDQSDATEGQNEMLPVLPSPMLRKRLEMFLLVFGSVTSPRQLFQHNLLLSLYNVLVSKNDAKVANLAFDCILTYKPANILVYKDVFKGLLDDSSIRSQLVTFDPSVGAVIESSQRAEVIPMLQQILFGKFTSKPRGGRASRDQSLSW
jgi:hypothetical protein